MIHRLHLRFKVLCYLRLLMFRFVIGSGCTVIQHLKTLQGGDRSGRRCLGGLGWRTRPSVSLDGDASSPRPIGVRITARLGWRHLPRYRVLRIALWYRSVTWSGAERRSRVGDVAGTTAASGTIGAAVNCNPTATEKNNCNYLRPKTTSNYTEDNKWNKTSSRTT